ncbi:type IV conjugative transfer system coupling protein TraD [Hahella ganghwensis]|uniref:type IV conjugative transfer system coupling protein TraD n=1 Tax=Hahella ganghwensis TaxID=286420 RepID=UPI000382DC88|nr:type IV conjugative transfer system coupling protein TraD [Hahella ganghwensis]
MANQYPIESLLRPVVEFYSVACLSLLAILALLGQWLFFFTPDVSILAFCILTGRAYIRFAQGWRIYRYQKGLLKLKIPVMSSADLPVSKRTLYMGIGFPWDQRHTQRLFDLSLKSGSKYLRQSWSYRIARRIERYFDATRFEFLSRALASQIFWNPLKPLPASEGQPAIHAVGLLEGEYKIEIDLGVRPGHTRVLGTTRVGKTRLAELLIAQDIRRGEVVIVIDPKGDPDLFKRMYVEARAAGRLDKLYFFHLGYPNISARYNPVSDYLRVTEVAARVAGQMPGEGPSQAFREFVWRYVNVISKCLNALGKKIDYEQIKYYGEDIDPLVVEYVEFLMTRGLQKGEVPKDWKVQLDEYEKSYRSHDSGFKRTRNNEDRTDRALAAARLYKELGLKDNVAHSLIKTFEYDKKHFDNLVASLLPLMEKLCTGKCSELISPDYLDLDDPRPIFNWQEIIATGGIVYVGLDALSDPEVASAVGNSMFADLTARSGRLYKQGAYAGLPDAGVTQSKINVHADEFNELIGDEFIPLLNKAGGSGIQVTAYTQTWSDVEARVNSEAKAGQIGGNFNTSVYFRVIEPKTAKLLTESLKQVPIDLLTTVSAASDSSDPSSSVDFTSRTEDRASSQLFDLIHVNDIYSLPKGHCFIQSEGGKLWKSRLPLPDKSDFVNIPQNIVDLTEDMAAKYHSCSRDWYKFTPSWEQSHV